MDNFRRFNHHDPGRRAASIDGFVRARRRSPRPADNAFVRHRALSAPRPRLDDFARPAGFRPAERAAMARSPLGEFERRPPRDPDGQIAASQPVAPASRHARRAQPAGRRLAMKAMGLLMVVGLVSAGYIFGQALLSAQQTFGGGAATIEENIRRDGRINVLLIGRGGATNEAPDLTDTLILASLDPVNNQAALVSIPRDLYIRPAAHGGFTKINAVYANAKNAAREEGSDNERAQQIGLQAIQRAVSDFTGVDVNYYVMVDFEAFKRAVDAVGGVDVNVPPELAVVETMRIDGRTYRLNVPAGQQRFDGFRALAFARSRLTSPQGDFTRSERQKLILKALGDKVLDAGTFANPVRVTRLVDALGDHVRTNLSGLAELARLYEIGRAIGGERVRSISLAEPPNRLVETDNIGGLSVVVPTAGLGQHREIQEFLGQQLRDGFLARENAGILVLNGTDQAGLAARVASDLKVAGHTVVKVDDAPVRGRADTVVIRVSDRDMPKTADRLARLFNLRVTAGQPPDGYAVPMGTDFVVVVGTDRGEGRSPRR